MEVASGLVIIWQFRHQVLESREHTAHRLIAVSVFALAAYVTVDFLTALAPGSDQTHPRSASHWPRGRWP